MAGGAQNHDREHLESINKTQTWAVGLKPLCLYIIQFFNAVLVQKEVEVEMAKTRRKKVEVS